MKRFVAALAIVAGAIGVIASCASPPPPLPDCEHKNGLILCGAMCVTPETDTENCGTCGNQCAAGEACVNGVCGTQCPTGNLLCAKDGGAATCVNAMTDNANCGACGAACSSDRICYNGQCNGTCGDAITGQTVCTPDGGPQYCANLRTDRSNCGSCGNACSQAQACVSGACTNECAPNQTFCNNGGSPFCTDTTTDNANCGGCGNACTGALNVCSGGQCGSECNPYQALCTADGGVPFCVNAKTDNDNCGTCGHVCPSSKPMCASGACTATPPQGIVYFTNGTTQGISIVPCGNGTNTNCTSAKAISSCTAIGKQLVAYDNPYSTSNVTAISTASYEDAYYTVGYFINYDSSRAGQCLVAVQGVDAYYCGSGEWNGAVEVIPSSTGTQFGYIYSFDQGYQSTFTNTVNTYMYCTLDSSNAPSATGCTTYYVACL
jgi:Stigma-specific protein, Stig1